jgi:hypothetical protein
LAHATDVGDGSHFDEIMPHAAEFFRRRDSSMRLRSQAEAPRGSKYHMLLAQESSHKPRRECAATALTGPGRASNVAPRAAAHPGKGLG